VQVVVAAAIRRDGLLLVAQRSRPSALAGLWELPGGKVEAGEHATDALSRECREELGVDVAIEERVGADLPINADWVLRTYAARILTGDPQPLEHLDLRWVTPDALSGIAWVPGNERLIPDLRELLTA
jgi:8-oxo-dGTP diphosphatase